MVRKIVNYFLLKFTDYNKVKRENEILKKQIQTLVLNPKSLESEMIKFTIKFKNSFDEQIWLEKIKGHNYFSEIIKVYEGEKTNE
jgi:ferredoxin-fold anticodon binding domain-containing protein